MKLDGRPNAAAGPALAPEQLAARVRDAQAGDAAVPVVISADRGVKYEAVVKAMDALRSAGVERVGLLVKSGG